MKRDANVHLNIIKNIAILMVADADAEISTHHSDEAESEVETIEILRDKAQAIVAEADKALLVCQ